MFYKQIAVSDIVYLYFNLIVTQERWGVVESKAYEMDNSNRYDGCGVLCIILGAVPE